MKKISGFLLTILFAAAILLALLGYHASTLVDAEQPSIAKASTESKHRQNDLQTKALVKTDDKSKIKLAMAEFKKCQNRPDVQAEVTAYLHSAFPELIATPSAADTENLAAYEAYDVSTLQALANNGDALAALQLGRNIKGDLERGFDFKATDAEKKIAGEKALLAMSWLKQAVFNGIDSTASELTELHTICAGTRTCHWDNGPTSAMQVEILIWRAIADTQTIDFMLQQEVISGKVDEYPKLRFSPEARQRSDFEQIQQKANDTIEQIDAVRASRGLRRFVYAADVVNAEKKVAALIERHCKKQLDELNYQTSSPH